MRIQFRLDGRDIVVSLVDSATASELVALLPLTVQLSDFHGIEKVADLPGSLSTQGAPPGHAAAAGELALYAPWGNLAFFHRPFDYAAGLVPLGTVEGDVSVVESIRDGEEAVVTALG